MTATRRFHDRAEAGRMLATMLESYRGAPGLLVLGLPRGGVPVAAEVARALDAPLDLFLVRKLGLPEHPELAMGAISSGGTVVVNPDVVQTYGVSDATLEAVAETERAELERRESVYRGHRDRPALAARTVILVDDGLATGASMRAAVEAARAQQPASLVVAVPVGARETCDELAGLADDVRCHTTPEPFRAVGLWYRDFRQTTDEEVVRLLRQARV